MGVGVDVGLGLRVDLGLADVDINMGMAPSTDAGKMRADRDVCKIEECGGVEDGRGSGLAECKQAACKRNWAKR